MSWWLATVRSAPRSRRRCAGSGVDHAVSFVGYQEDVVSAYAAMDVFVLPSRDEGFGLVFLEAMAVGVPVVGTRVIGSEEAVEDGVTGLLVPYADPAALAHAVRRLLGDAEPRAPPPGHRGGARPPPVLARAVYRAGRGGVPRAAGARGGCPATAPGSGG